jgi:tellurite resistance protein
MLILMAESRGAVRRDRLERSAKVLSKDEPFASLGAEKRNALIREQTIVVEFAPERAIATLPQLLTDFEDRQRAIDTVEFIAGSHDEMDPQTIKTLEKMRAILGLAPLVGSGPVADPLEGIVQKFLPSRGRKTAASDA